MQEEIIYIKNMVCPRCVRVVREDLESAGFQVNHVEIGQASINTLTDGTQRSKIEQLLQAAGFELMQDEESKLIEQVKIAVAQLIEPDAAIAKNNSGFISEFCGKSYGYLSKMFSSSENQTIEKYIIEQKIMKVKEWLRYDEMPLKEIAYQLGYSSVAHLSAQFKQVCGQTITAFKAR